MVPAAPADRSAFHAGLTTEDEDKPWVLEAQQGDRISGKISRAQVASVAVAAIGTEASIGGHHCCGASLPSGSLPLLETEMSSWPTHTLLCPYWLSISGMRHVQDMSTPTSSISCMQNRPDAVKRRSCVS